MVGCGRFIYLGFTKDLFERQLLGIVLEPSQGNLPVEGKSAMRNYRIQVSIVALFLLMMTGCQSGFGWPRWDWWRSAKTGPSDTSLLARNASSQLPPLPSSGATPSGLASSQSFASSTGSGSTAVSGTYSNLAGGNPPATSYPNTATYPRTAESGSIYPKATYPTTQASGLSSGVGATSATGYSSTYPSSSVAPQSGPYNPNAYNPNAYASSTTGMNSGSGTRVAASLPGTSTTGVSTYPTSGTPSYPTSGVSTYPTSGVSTYPTSGTLSPSDSAAGNRYAGQTGASPGSSRYGAVASPLGAITPSTPLGDYRGTYPTTGVSAYHAPTSPANYPPPASMPAWPTVPSKYRPGGTSDYTPQTSTPSGTQNPQGSNLGSPQSLAPPQGAVPTSYPSPYSSPTGSTAPLGATPIQGISPGISGGTSILR